MTEKQKRIWEREATRILRLNAQNQRATHHEYKAVTSKAGDRYSGRGPAKVWTPQ